MNRKISSVRTIIARSAQAGTVLVVALASASAVAAPASASTGPMSTRATWTRLMEPHSNSGNYSLISGTAALSGGGHKWNVSVTSFIEGAAANGVGIEITTPHLGGLETHSWAGALPESAISVSPEGKMTIASGSALAPVLTLNVTFTPTSHKTGTSDCSVGNEVVYTGTLTGSVSLNTSLKGLKLRGTGLKFGKTSTLTNSTDCVLAPCAWSAWDSSTRRAGAFAGGMIFHYPGQRLIADTYVDDALTLDRGKIIRIDEALLANAPAPKFTKATRSLSVTTGKAGLVTGAATLAHGKPGSYPLAKICRFNGKTYSVSGTKYSKAKYDVSKPFEAHTILNGVIKVVQQGVTDFEIVTLKLK
jgi:hypothetical protein